MSEQEIQVPAQLTTTGDPERRIEDRMNAGVHGALEVSATVGGVAFTSALEVMEFAKLMSVAKTAVPQYLRGNPGGCLAIAFQAIEWRMSPFQVANKSYIVNDRIAYESQLVHAVIEARAPLQGRLRCSYDGEGPDRVCIVTGKFRGEDEPHIYHSPKIKDIRPQNSPLWKSEPDQQQWYYASRAWCRRYAPDILLGIYSSDELDGPVREMSDAARDVTPRSAIANRLGENGPRGGGYDPTAIEAELKTVAAPIETKPRKKSKEPAASSPEVPGEPQQEGATAPADRDGVAPSAVPVPSTEAEYEEFVKAKIDTGLPRDELLEWFNGGDQGKLRKACGVSSEKTAALRSRIKALA